MPPMCGGQSGQRDSAGRREATAKGAHCDRVALKAFPRQALSRPVGRDCHIHESLAIIVDSRSQQNSKCVLERKLKAVVSFGPAFPLWHKGRSRRAKEASQAGKYRFALSGIVPGRANPGKERRPA
jgi:hypothetical protein